MVEGGGYRKRTTHVLTDFKWHDSANIVYHRGGDILFRKYSPTIDRILQDTRVENNIYMHEAGTYLGELHPLHLHAPILLGL